ncbi:unnamed protein product, partial [Laminaria digitata]
GKGHCRIAADTDMARMLSSTRVVACCAFVVILVVPSHMISTAHSGCHPLAFVTKHDTQNGHQQEQQHQQPDHLHQQQQQQQRRHQQDQDHQHQRRRLHRQQKQELGCGTWHPRLPSFIAIPTRPTSAQIVEIGGATHARSHHSSTALGAASGKGKSSKATKKKKSGSSRGGGGGGGRGSSSGGFGASSIATAAKPGSSKVSTSPTTTTSTSTTTAATATATTDRPSQPAALLPDDDFATFPPLSPDTLKSVMGVDIFDLPPGGVSARETSQHDALPPQVLACIRDRHGFPEFAGGMRLLDTAYQTETVGAGTGEDATASSSAAAAAAAVADG